jgi:hypothetical protein
MKSSMVGMLRLANQRVSLQTHAKPQAVAAWMGAMQAQDATAVKRAVAVRTRGEFTEAKINNAIARGEIVRAWSLRGTIQLVPAQDARWMAGIAAARVAASASPVERSLGITDEDITQTAKILAKTLKNSKVMERSALYEVLEAKGVSTKGQRGYHLLWRAGLTGLICFGPRSEKQPTFTLMADWAPQLTRLPRPAAIAELARRYFRSHGPATIQDFAWWTGLSLTESKQAHEAIRDEMIEEEIEGASYWLYATSTTDASGFYLLPGFDEFILGYKDRNAVIDPNLAPALSPYKNGIFLPVLVSGGRVVGTWSRTLGKTGLQVEAKPFAGLGAKEKRSLKAEAARYADYLGVAVEKVTSK